MSLTRSAAFDILDQVGATTETDFHTLGSSEVESVLASADLYKYRKPRNANGSRGRYFFAYVQRVARRDED